MDMQNVLNLQIPEGVVRTIHDKDNRLLWGRLAYDTKYAGNSLQNGIPTSDTPVPVQVVTGAQTVEVHGKNLLGLDNFSGSFSSNQYTEFGNILDIKSAYGIAASLDVTLNSFKYTKTSQYDSNQKWNFKGLQPNTNYTISCNYSITSASSTSTYLFGAYRAVSGNSLTQSFTTNGNGEKEFTLQFYGSAQNDVVELTNLMVEPGSTFTSYEPYQNQDYTVNLGSIELCKIGTYQDYIYKSGDDWYVHKEFGKYVFDGSETIAYNSSNKGFTINPTNLPNYMPNHATPPMVGLSTHFSVNSTTSTWTGDNRIGLSSSGTFWCKATSFANSKDDCLAWLSANTPSVYYALATAADTKITDATLAGQLNDVHEWLTRYGYNATVTGNLPIIIDKTNL